MFKMLRVPELAELDLPAVPDETPVTTRSPACTPETICVFTPSLIPVCTGTELTLPLRMTLTLPLAMAPVGTSTVLSTCWVMIVTVAVMLGSSWTSVWSTEIRTV